MIGDYLARSPTPRSRFQACDRLVPDAAFKNARMTHLLDFGIDPRLIYGAMWFVAMGAISIVVLYGFGE